MPFIYQRTVRFQDTDAAGVIYFANVLAICHEAYEASLAAAGVNLKQFFSRGEVAIPIVHASVSFVAPMFCGDRLEIRLTPQQLRDSEFEIDYEIAMTNQPDSIISTAQTRHVCITIASRTRKELPANIMGWLQQWADNP